MIIRHAGSRVWRRHENLLPSLPRCESIGLLHDRKFHASRPRPFINEAIQASAAAFHLVHDTTGLAWGLSIPLTAALYQLAFTPLHYIVDRNRKARGQTATLLQAWQTIYREQERSPKLESDTLANAARAEKNVKAKLAAKSKQLQREMGYMGIWLGFTPLTYIPVWLSNVSALVEMCGNAGEPRVISASGTNGVAAEPALDTDGFLWFTDLTVADPLFLLPLATGGLFVAHILQIRSRSTGPANVIQKVMLTFALLSGPLFIAAGTSNAILLAMMGSSLVAMTRSAALDRIVGSRSGQVKPAKPKLAVPKAKHMLGERHYT